MSYQKQDPSMLGEENLGKDYITWLEETDWEKKKGTLEGGAQHYQWKKIIPAYEKGEGAIKGWAKRPASLRSFSLEGVKQGGLSQLKGGGNR